MQIQQIYREYPGYTWVGTETQRVLEWKPISGIYSPPRLQNPMRVRTVPVSKEVEAIVGRLIGKDGCFLKWITERSRTDYIFFRHGVFEIWGPSERSVRFAVNLLHQHMENQLAKKNN